MQIVSYFWPSNRAGYDALPRNKELSPDEVYKYQGFSCLSGVLFIISSAIALGLGNSLDPLSTMALIYPFLLITGFEISNAQFGLFWTILLILVTQSAGFTLGFSGLFTTQVPFPLSLELCYLASILIWISIVGFAIIPHYLFTRRFPRSILCIFIFPTTTTTLVHSIIGPCFSTFTSIANAVLDYGPLRQSSSVFGLAFVHFFVMLLGTIVSFIYLGLHKNRIKRAGQFFIVFVSILFLYSNIELIAIRFYQTNISGPTGLENIPTVQASCVYGQQALNLSTQWNELWNSTNKRLAMGDTFVLWSEESASIFSLGQEAALLKQGTELVRRYGFKSFLGLTYIMTILDSPGIVTVTNNFALIAPDGSVAWIYEKAFPVPIVEANVMPGDRILPKYNHSKYGTISGAICFDIEFPDYIRGAGEMGVNIFLHPSWTWGDVGSRQFDAGAVRAVENGFTLISCASDGESGVVSPTGVISAREYTGHDPMQTATFNVQLMPRVETLYTIVGFLFSFSCNLFVFFIFIATMLPDCLSSKIFPFLWLDSNFEEAYIDVDSVSA